VNFALPALVIFLGILPGICCFYGYFAGRFNKRTAGIAGAEEFALYVIFAIPINATALWTWQWLGSPFNFSVATHLLTGNISDAAVHNEVATYFQDSTSSSTGAYLALLIGSFLIGSSVRRFVWTSRLDTIIPHLRLKHGWFYVLQGRIHGLPRVVLSYVDVLTRLPDKDGAQTRLYRGLVVDFEISSSGTIDSLTLKNAVRGSGRGTDFKWKDIPSTRFLIMGSTIHSINVTYLEIDQQDKPRGLRNIRVWFRRFFLEEP
jgi:hypothetical protein